MPRVYSLKHSSEIPSDAVYVGRGRGSIFGNPFTHINDRQTAAKYVVNTRRHAVESYASWVIDQDEIMNKLHLIRDKDLVCWCHEWDGQGDNPMYCHADVLIELAGKVSFASR